MAAAASASLLRRERDGLLREALAAGRLERAPAERIARGLGETALREAVCEAAFESKRSRFGDRITVSKNVFVPLTNLCRDRCAYCTFAKPDDDPEAKTYRLDEVEEVVRGGLRAGCTEALFCLGDKPELAYRSYRRRLEQQGFASTADFLTEASKRAFELGMLPHSNAGILDAEQMTRLMEWNASLGLMLESTSQRLRAKGGAHYYAPDKDPAIRLRMHEEAGELGIPFTSGLLLGIGETYEERVDTLFAIRELHERHGHIQEVIVQPFHPKFATPMGGVAPIADLEVAGWVALARLVLGPAMHVQAPPNLAPEALEALARSGLDDWGGVSPLTLDFINPEAPWPALGELEQRTRASGQRLALRLPVYPEFLFAQRSALHPRVRAAALARTGADGLLPGGAQEVAA